MPLDPLAAALVAVEDNADLLAEKAAELVEPTVASMAHGVASKIADSVARQTARDVATKAGSDALDAIRVATERLPGDVTAYFDSHPAPQGDKGEKGDSIKGDAGINWRGPFRKGTVYQTDDAVSFEGSSYIAARPTRATPPASPWQLLARKGKDGVDGNSPMWFGGGGGSGGGASLSNATPLIEAGLGASGAGTLASRDDHVHPDAAGSGTPSATVASETTYGISSTAGVSGDYSRGDHTHGSPATPTAASVGAGPSTVDYLVGTASAGLSAEIVVGTTPGGELGNTWASPTVDATHSGSSHAATQAAAEATAAGALASHEADTTSVHGIANTANLYASWIALKRWGL